MTNARKFLLAAAAGGALASAVLAASPATAFDPVYNDGRRPYAGDYYGPAPYGYPDYGYVHRWGPDIEVGTADVPMCPPSYHFSPREGLCWPD